MAFDFEMRDWRILSPFSHLPPDSILEFISIFPFDTGSNVFVDLKALFFRINS